MFPKLTSSGLPFRSDLTALGLRLDTDDAQVQELDARALSADHGGHRHALDLVTQTHVAAASAGDGAVELRGRDQGGAAAWARRVRDALVLDPALKCQALLRRHLRYLDHGLEPTNRPDPGPCPICAQTRN